VRFGENLRFGGTYRLHLQGGRVNQEGSQQQDGFLIGLLADPEDGDGITVQKIVAFTFTALRTSNPARYFLLPPHSFGITATKSASRISSFHGKE
jgi:hypothetical protein